MLIPPRAQATWVAIEGTQTTYADPVCLLGSRIIRDVPASNVMLAYPATPLGEPTRYGIRIDFLWTVQIQYSSFFGRDPTESEDLPRRFALAICDRSAFKESYLLSRGDPEWDRGFASSPNDTLRHLHIAFDDFGHYDVLAAHCAVREFPMSPLDASTDRSAWNSDARATHTAREAQLLRDSLTLDRPSLPRDLLR
jgi:hypothetical protein